MAELDDYQEINPPRESCERCKGFLAENQTQRTALRELAETIIALREARADDLECAYHEGWRDAKNEIGNYDKPRSVDKCWEHSATKELLEQDNE